MTEKYFNFLRFSLTDGTKVPASVSDIDWHGLYRFGKEQALLGVLYEGVKRLPQGVCTDIDLLATWMVMARNISTQNKYANVIAAEIQERLRKDGIRSCILKGQGNALLYPNPLSRNPGDIDIWVVGQTRRQIVDYCKSHLLADNGDALEGVHFHHVEFDYKGVTVEMHFLPGIENNPFYNHRLQAWYRRDEDVQCSNFVRLPGDGGQIAIPTVTFNMVYQMAHLYHHFFDEGIGLRQLVDYYLLLTRNSETVVESKTQLERDLRHVGLYKFAGAVMWVLHKTLHLSEQLMIVKPDAKRGEVLLNEVLNGGNFGRYDTKYGGLTQQSTARKYFTKVKRSLTFFRLYPSEAISEPLFRTWHFFWRIGRK